MHVVGSGSDLAQWLADAEHVFTVDDEEADDEVERIFRPDAACQPSLLDGLTIMHGTHGHSTREEMQAFSNKPQLLSRWLGLLPLSCSPWMNASMPEDDDAAQ
uniref:Uncharacterized protein n=1 Tax=Haptolina ericina TaxID=156174 RepID=A0A7S3ER92_9EUKA|mmetsp:Transcript_10571/g.24244  ORF Transcript_10571/g.24244 Transcript_10571/m.24244 type:complete len:103 (+) Transcript_10571:28-336(+)|eukprot:CAMPEP_0181212732 /NCGR_PEP_ID=MMETSP1096-20121128/24514_1 /TAXON_ID=156174 ORGANISM="Chrysochromulina ericina, Strain CCMP281" /NCGR_SAMPLE_ID=MMETSP1096 /ASSEMBLY_ACC=CAM_ASM_000453 /LENGTH=102 /DNA_ID=CAMNT_0023304295 /DNA_START=27 /DNA_END=335 /DNA_ORIENTATION=-